MQISFFYTKLIYLRVKNAEGYLLNFVI